MELVELLYNLQKYDDALARLAKDLGELEKKAAGINGEISAEEKKINVLEKKIKVLNIEITQNEKETEFIDAQIVKLSARFLLIKNEKELAKYNAEMDKLKKEKADFEEKTLKKMEECDSLKLEINKTAAVIESKKKLYSVELKDLSEQIKNQKAEIEKVKKHREDFSGSIPTASVEKYNTLFKTKAGMAVSVIKHKVCSGCRLTISESIIASSRPKTKVSFCPNCQRIIFIE
ncbi:MAG: C4-type zinc ribbon domain-containing protein [Candidatus Wallbacteria bacterium]